MWCSRVINEHWETDSGLPSDVYGILILLHLNFAALFTVSYKHISLYLLTLQEHISLMTVNNFVSFFVVGMFLAAFVY